MSSQVVSQLTVKWPVDFTGVPKELDPLKSDQKTQKVFAELIEEERFENLPLVIAYHKSFDFIDARSLEEPFNFEAESPIAFFALFPNKEKLSFIGTSSDAGKKRVLELFLNVIHGRSVHQSLETLSIDYQNSKHGKESKKAKQLMQMSAFHKDVEEERRMNDRVVRDPAVIYEEAVKLFDEPGKAEKAFKKLNVISSRFYKPAYFPLFLCYHYGHGIKQDPIREKDWLERAINYKDPRAIKWVNKSDFSFTAFADDFKVCNALHNQAKEILLKDWFYQPA